MTCNRRTVLAAAFLAAFTAVTPVFAAKPLVIGWGRLDRVCFPRQAARAQQLFPDARLHWFERCGHFPHWDAPEETARLILETTSD